MQGQLLREAASQWVAGLDAAFTSKLSSGESNALIREVFAAFLLLRWTDLQESEQEAIAVFEGRTHEPLLPPPLQWRHWSQLEKPNEIARRLSDLALRVASLRGSGAEPLAAYLHVLAEPLRRILEVNFTYLRDLMRWVGELPFETASERREVLDAFDRVLAETQEAREEWFASPSAIARLVAMLANPRPGERIYDPCFGIGRFLVEAWDQARSSRDESARPGPLLEVSGVEVNAGAFLVGLVRMLLAGIDSPRLELGDALERSPVGSPMREGFDVVLADPPWGKVGRESRERGLYQQYPFPSTDAVGLFIQHALAQLKPHGRAVIAVPEGFLFRGGAERDLRRSLIERGQVEAVVGLPAGAFAPKTQVRSCLLVLSNRGGVGRVRMADAASLFSTRPGAKEASLPREMARQLATELFRPELSPRHSLPIGASLSAPQTGKLSRSIWEVEAEAFKANDWDLTPRRREEGGLADLLEGLQDLSDGESRVFPITEVAEVIAGRAIKSKDLTDEPNGQRPIGYLRIKDIGPQKVAMRPSRWLSETVQGVERQWALRPGDVLLSKSGTIGKAGLVRNGAVGSIAASGLYVLRVNPEWLDPGYLMAYLASPTVQSWLAARARGSAIQHLNRSVVEALPVIVPPLAMQARASAQYRDSGADVLEFLRQASGASESDRLTTWLAELDSKVPASTGLDATPAMDLIEPIVAMATTGRRWIEAEQVATQSLRWFEPLVAALMPLGGMAQIPSGASLLTVLQDAERAFQRVAQEATGHLPTESQARAVAERLRDWMLRAISDLFEYWHLGVHAPAVQLVAGDFAEFVVELRNEGPLPLRSVRVQSEPDWGGAQSSFLAEDEPLKLTLRGDVPKNAESLTFQLRWSARNLNGQEIGQTVELALPVVARAAVAALRRVDLGDNPYVTGSPLEPTHGHRVFFGRESLLAQIGRQVGAHGNVILLEGNRRAGKTSILKHLEGKDAIPGWLAVYASLQAAEGAKNVVGVPTAEVFRLIAGETAKSVTKLSIDVPLPNGGVITAGKPALGVAKACREGISDDAPFADFREYLDLILRTLETTGLRLLLMLDEFDKLQEGIDKGVTSPQVPENIRFLIQSNSRFSAILTGSRRLKRLREEHWSALYGLGTSVQVTALDDESARMVVTVPVEGRLTYSTEAVESVVSLAARQPYLMQCLCNRIFDYAVQSKSQAVTLGTVDSVAKALVRDNEHFASLWDYAGMGPVSGRHRRHVMLFWCAEGFKRGTQITFASLREQLTQSGIEVAEELLVADLDYLRELELVDLVGEIGGSHYRLSVPLMGDWIEQHQDSAAIIAQARAEAEEENG